VLAIVLVVFGPGRLPELGASLGKSIREFKKGLEDSDSSPPRPTDERITNDDRRP
jgi:sec-independent protein translocase protein TatA